MEDFNNIEENNLMIPEPERKNTAMISTLSYDEIKNILVKYTDHPKTPIFDFLTDLRVPKARSIVLKLKHQNIIVFSDIYNLRRDDWKKINLDPKVKEIIITKLKYLKHFNRFEQQSKNFVNFVILPNTFVLIMILISLFSILVFFITNFESSSYTFKPEIDISLRYDEICKDSFRPSLEWYNQFKKKYQFLDIFKKNQRNFTFKDFSNSYYKRNICRVCLDLKDLGNKLSMEKIQNSNFDVSDETIEEGEDLKRGNDKDSKEEEKNRELIKKSLNKTKLLKLPNSEQSNEIIFYMYFKLTKFHQNYRSYISSISYQQLAGYVEDSNLCSPFDKLNGKLLYPCGKVAISYFNDFFFITLNSKLSNINTSIPINKEEAMRSNEMLLFRNLYEYYEKKDTISDYYLRPINNYKEIEKIERVPIDSSLYVNWNNFAVKSEAVKLYGTFKLKRSNFIKIYGNNKSSEEKEEEKLCINIINKFDNYSYGGEKYIIFRTKDKIISQKRFLYNISFFTFFISIVAGIILPFFDAYLRKRREKRREVKNEKENLRVLVD